MSDPTIMPAAAAKGDKSRSGALVAYIDGGSRGNPGVAGAGVYFELEGAPWRGLFQYLGRQTNNFAEYSSLLAALEYAIKNGFSEIQVRADSELLVRQMLGRYRVKNPALKRLHEQAMDLIRLMRRFSLEHIARERNRRADALVNKAQNLQQSGEERYET